MKSEADVVRKIIWRKDLDEMEVIGTRMFSVGVPIEADPEFKAYVFAAGVTHSMGNSSVDAQLRRNRGKWIDSFRPEQSKLGSAEQLMKIVRTRALMRVHELTALDLSGASSGAAAAANVLIRLASTFRGALQLVRLGFAFESEAVTRLGFEQISWAYAVAPLTDIGEIERASPTKSVTKLKELLPAAGRIYGRLSELAHVLPDTHHRFVSVDSDDKVRITIQAHDATRESLFLLVLLLDAFYVVSEARFHVYGFPSPSLNHTRTEAAPERSTAALLREYGSALPPNAESTFASWSTASP